MNGYSDRLLAAVRQLNGIGQEPDIEPDIPDHAEAFCAWINGCKLRIERGESVHEVAAEMILPVTFAARRI